MAHQRSRATGTDRASQSLKGDVRRLLADASVEQLKRLGRALGNEGLAAKLGHNDALRDLLLDVVRERLAAIEAAQKAELKSLHERGPWWRRLQRGQRGIAMPEPTRWAEPARLFRQAADSLCAGDLGRGAELLKQATESERAHRKAVPTQVKLARESAPGTGVPAAIGEVHDGEGCTPTTAPDVVALAGRIENVAETHRDATHLPNARHAGQWWEVEVDEEAEKKLRDNPRSSKRLLEPAAAADLRKRGGSRQVVPAEAVREVRTEVAVAAPEKGAPAPEKEVPAPEVAETKAAPKPRTKPRR